MKNDSATANYELRYYSPASTVPQQQKQKEARRKHKRKRQASSGQKAENTNTKQMQLKLIFQNVLLLRRSVFAFHQIKSSNQLRKVCAQAQNTFPVPLTSMLDTASRRNMSSASSNTEEQQQLIFGKFKISKSQIFYESPSDLSAAIVNLRPIVPGHVLVIPKRIVPKLSQLTNEEYDDLWRSVRTVQNALENYYNAGGFNIAVQDGKQAGQSVPHVHVHILPRQEGDFERNDDVYDKLEDWAPTRAMSEEKQRNKVELEVPDDDDRKDRTMQMMEEESQDLKNALLGTEANI